MGGINMAKQNLDEMSPVEIVDYFKNGLEIISIKDITLCELKPGKKESGKFDVYKNLDLTIIPTTQKSFVQKIVVNDVIISNCIKMMNLSKYTWQLATIICSIKCKLSHKISGNTYISYYPLLQGAVIETLGEKLNNKNEYINYHSFLTALFEFKLATDCFVFKDGKNLRNFSMNTKNFIKDQLQNLKKGV